MLWVRMKNANVIPLATRYAGVAAKKAVSTVRQTARKAAPVVKRYAKGLGETALVLGQAAGAMATEPFTNKRLKEIAGQPTIRKAASPIQKRYINGQ